MARQPLPGFLSRSVEQAGASAYAWHDQELAAFLDPKGHLRRASHLLRWGTVTCATVALLLCAWLQPGWITKIAATSVIFAGLAWRRLKMLPWYASAAYTLIVAQSSLPLPGVWIATVLALWGLARLGFIRDHYLDYAFLLPALAAGACGAWSFGPTSTTVIGATLLIATLGLGAARVFAPGGQSWPRPLGRVSASDLMARPPSPGSRLPLLLRWRRREEIANPPDSIRRKRIGGDGERYTAVLLLALARRRGTRLVHDVMIPGAERANADHVALAFSGLRVIDSKQFGRRDDPGEVVYDMGSREVVHRSKRGARSIESSVRTAVWAAKEVGKVVGIPCSAILAVHNARVAPGLNFERDGIQVHIISSWDLVDHIDTAPRALSIGQLAAGRIGLLRLRSALNGDAPRIVSPKGANASMRALLNDKRSHMAVHPKAQLWRSGSAAQEKSPRPSLARLPLARKNHSDATRDLKAAKSPSIRSLPRSSGDKGPVGKGHSETDSSSLSSMSKAQSRSKPATDRWAHMEASKPRQGVES